MTNETLEPTNSDATEKTPLMERIKAQFRSVAGDDEAHARAPRDLARDVETFGRQFNGLVGKVAETGTKPETLASQFERYQKRLESSDPANLEAGRVIVRKLIQPLVEMKNLDDEHARKLYEDELVDTFNSYVTLSDNDRELFNDVLGARYEFADKLKHRGETPDKQETVEEISDEERTEAKLTITRLALGDIALIASRATNGMKEYWSERKARKAEASDNDAATSRVDTAKEKLSNAYLRVAYETGSLFNKARQEFSNKVKDREGRKAGETDEAYERRMRRNGRNVMLGVVAVAGVAVASKLGAFDGIFDVKSDGNFSDRLHDSVSDKNGSDAHGSSDIAPPQEIGEVTTFEPKAPTGNESAILFSGEGGSTRLSVTNANLLKDFLDTYKVKDGDNQGVWGISEKYLQTQGVKNPTVFETDAVKDYILQHSPLTDSSVIHPGDTISLK
jgi:hypothetical protein